jgi:hypothetical protein
LGVDAAGQTNGDLKKKTTKKPIGIIWIDVTYDDISYVRGLYG